MKNKPPIIAWILLALTTIIFVYIRLRLLSLPLERDEGEYAYAGQRILHGGVPYRDIYNMKFPGVYYFYALILALFGNTVAAIRLGAIIINLLTAFFILKAVQKLKNLTAGMFAAASFIILSSSPGFQGIMANTEHFVNLFVAISAFFLFSWINNPKKILLLLTGIVAGFACLMKQHGSYFILVGIATILIYVQPKKGNLLKIAQCTFILLGGFCATLLLLLALVLITHTFHEFVFLTIKYGSSYVSYHSFSYGISHFFISFFNDSRNNQPIWILALISVIFSYKLVSPKTFWVLLIWFIFSIVAVFPGYYFREHYFLLLAPAASCYCGLLFNTILSRKNNSYKFLFKLVAYTLFIISAGYLLIGERDNFFINSPSYVSYLIYGTQFDEADIVADTLTNYLKPNQHVLVVGSEPEMYFYTKGIAGSSYMYAYPMTEHQPYRDSMLSEYARQAIHSDPEVIIVSGKWEFRDTCQKRVLFPLLASKPGYYVKGCCYQDGAYNEPFLWNADDSKIPRDSMLWEIFIKNKN